MSDDAILEVRIFCRNVRRLRRELGISKRKFADLADLSLPTIDNIEALRSTYLHDKTVLKIAKLLGVSPARLYEPGAGLSPAARVLIMPNDKDAVPGFCRLEVDRVEHAMLNEFRAADDETRHAIMVSLCNTNQRRRVLPFGKGG